MFPDPKKIFLSLLILMMVSILDAQEKFCFFQIRTDLTAQLPAPDARKKAMPQLFVEIGQNLEKNGISLNIPLIAFYGKNLLTEKKADQGFFLLYFHQLKAAQLRYLLKYKLLHPDWQYKEHNGMFHIDSPRLKFVLFQHKNADGFFAAPAYDLIAQAGAERMLKQIDFKSGNAASGVFYFSAESVQHPAMLDVRKAVFAVINGKNAKGEPTLRAVIELTGDTPERTRKIATDISLFLAGVYTNAEKEAAKTNRRLTDEERQAIICFFKSDKAILSISFNAEWTATFFQLFSKNLH